MEKGVNITVVCTFVTR